MIMKRKVVFQSVDVAIASAMLAGDKTKSERAFDRLTSLQDGWKGETGGVNTALIYTLTANCSALMEPMDGNHLIATHYCTAANQAQHGDASNHRCPEGVRIFSCPRDRLEIP